MSMVYGIRSVNHGTAPGHGQDSKPALAARGHRARGTGTQSAGNGDAQSSGNGDTQSVGNGDRERGAARGYRWVRLLHTRALQKRR